MKLLFPLVAMISAAFVSPAPAAEKTYDVSGVVRAPLDPRGRIAIAHDDIPGFMPAMTTGFTLANPAEGATLKAGDQVRFRLQVGESSSLRQRIIAWKRAIWFPIFLITEDEKVFSARGTSRAFHGDDVYFHPVPGS